MPKKSFKTKKSDKKDNKYATKGFVKKMIHANIENKYVVSYPSVNFETINDDWTEFDFCSPSQGDGLFQRTASQISVRSIELKMVMSNGSAETLLDDPYNVVRMVIGQYHGSDDAPLTTAGAGINDPIMTAISTKANLVKKFYDKYITLQVTGTEKGQGDGYTPQLKQISYYKMFKKPLRITWGDGGDDYPSSRLIISMISDSSATVHPGVVNGYIKVMFEDA